MILAARPWPCRPVRPRSRSRTRARRARGACRSAPALVLVERRRRLGPLLQAVVGGCHGVDRLRHLGVELGGLLEVHDRRVGLTGLQILDAGVERVDRLVLQIGRLVAELQVGVGVEHARLGLGRALARSMTLLLGAQLEVAGSGDGDLVLTLLVGGGGGLDVGIVDLGQGDRGALDGLHLGVEDLAGERRGLRGRVLRPGARNGAGEEEAESQENEPRVTGGARGRDLLAGETFSLHHSESLSSPAASVKRLLAVRFPGLPPAG